MRKIVFIGANEWTPWGGSENLWSGAAEKLAHRGVQVCVSVKDWGVPVKQVEQLRAAGCRVFKRPVPSLLRRAARNFFPEREYVRHVRKLAAGAGLVVVAQGINIDGLHWMEALRSTRHRYVVIAQTAAELWWPNDDQAERLAAGYEGACAAYFVSEANLALSRRQFTTPLLRGRVIRNPFNVPYDAKPPWPADAAEGLSLACVGRLDVVQKSQDLLIEVLSLPHWRNRNVRLSLLGQGVNERGLRRLVANLGLTNVRFEGFVEDIEEVWSRHQALVLPSRHEGMPLALVEAMLCSRPAIITDVAGHRELVRDGVNGFLAKAPTVELLDDAMNRAWDSRTRLRAMGDIAAIDVRQWVSADPVGDFVRQLDALVEEK